jgi:small subunit ribosomal protein S7
MSSTDEHKNVKEGSKVPRKGPVPKREVLPDPIYGDIVVTKLVNNIMLDGKKVLPKKSFTMHLKKLQKKLAKMPWKHSGKRWPISHLC